MHRGLKGIDDAGGDGRKLLGRPEDTLRTVSWNTKQMRGFSDSQTKRTGTSKRTSPKRTSDLCYVTLITLLASAAHVGFPPRTRLALNFELWTFGFLWASPCSLSVSSSDPASV